MSSIEVIEPAVSPFIRVAIDVNAGVDLTGAFGNPSYKFRHYSLQSIELEEATHEVVAGALVPFDNKRVEYRTAVGNFFLTANYDNTIVLYADSIPELKRVWLVIILEKVEA